MGVNRLFLLVVGVSSIGACDWLWPADGPYDPWRCRPRCAAGTVCHRGACVALDATVGATGDGPRDGGAADAAWVEPDLGYYCGAAEEQCKDKDLRGASCGTLGLGIGQLNCSPSCTYDTSGCGITMVPFNLGTYTVGAPDTEPCWKANEARRNVTLTRGFEIMGTEVTVGQFAATMGYEPAGMSQEPRFAAGGVTWFEAVAFCNALSRLSGQPECFDCPNPGPDVSCKMNPPYATPYDCEGFRLPTEAEWEVAYRAGRATALHNGDLSVMTCDPVCNADPGADEIAWYCANSDYQVHPVAEKKSNMGKLYDMAGNVAEWCVDFDNPSAETTDPWGAPQASSFRVHRGGSFQSPPFELRAALRETADPTSRWPHLGFRCARTR